MKKLLKKQIFILLSLLSMLLFSGCGDVSACDCARAALYDNATGSEETLKKCREKEADMTRQEKYDWNLEKINCL
jgi:hypothetical protein|tara:strand:+ start:206 stop:430 length:225 start_codon:yes stop_codon:yes gene_type:complete